MTTSNTLKDQRLQALGITQYQLRRFGVFHGEVALSLPHETKLIAIASSEVTNQYPLFQDIVRSMSLRMEQVYLVNAGQVVMLQETASLAAWVIGDFEEEINSIPFAFLLTSPDLTTLSQNVSAKRALWQQIQQHENYFPSHSE